MEKYKNPVVPSGYKYVFGEWNNGFTICDFNGSFWTWIPVDAILKDISDFSVKASNWKYNKRLELHGDREFLDAGDMVCKYGGIYVSSFDVSRDKTGIPVSAPGKMPWWNENFSTIKLMASLMGNGEQTFSHLTYNLEWDSVLKWLVWSKAKNDHEVYVDSSSWGNFWQENSAKILLSTGSDNKFIVNGMADIAGNAWKRMSDSANEGEHILRGGSFASDEKTANAWKICKDEYKAVDIGFRATLVVK